MNPFTADGLAGGPRQTIVRARAANKDPVAQNSEGSRLRGMDDEAAEGESPYGQRTDSDYLIFARIFFWFLTMVSKVA